MEAFEEQKQWQGEYLEQERAGAGQGRQQALKLCSGKEAAGTGVGSRRGKAER